jgi:hypothetical protein
MENIWPYKQVSSKGTMAWLREVARNRVWKHVYYFSILKKAAAGSSKKFWRSTRLFDVISQEKNFKSFLSLCTILLMTERGVKENSTHLALTLDEGSVSVSSG